MSTTTSSGEDGEKNEEIPKMGFGKYADWTYREVAMKQPGYCSWARSLEKPSWQMSKFIDWLDENETSLMDDDDEEEGYESFECWKDRYVAENQRRYPAGYCWEWLETGSCIGCCFKHSYPPQWSDKQKRQQHRARESINETLDMVDDMVDHMMMNSTECKLCGELVMEGESYGDGLCIECSEGQQEDDANEDVDDVSNNNEEPDDDGSDFDDDGSDIDDDKSSSDGDDKDDDPGESDKNNKRELDADESKQSEQDDSPNNQPTKKQKVL